MTTSGDTAPLRVVSLLPCATDMMHTLNLQHLIVGRSHECDAEGVGELPALTEAKYSLDQGLSSSDVHAVASTSGNAMWEATFGSLPRAATLVEWGLSPYRTDIWKLQELRPTTILTQVQTGSGAASREDTEHALHEWLGYRPILVHLDPQSLADVWQDVLRVAEALGERARGEKVVWGLQARMNLVRNVARGRPRRRVLCVQWMDPVFVAGAWVPQLISLAGGVAVGLGGSDVAEPECTPAGESSRGGGVDQDLEVVDCGVDAGQPSCSSLTSWDQIDRTEPEAVVFAICGSNLAQSIAEVKEALRRGHLAGLQKMKLATVAVVDASRLFSRAGPTLVESLEVLAEVLHPESQPFGHRGTLWAPFQLALPASSS
eukprot:jgi/Mesen1/5332/ME000266S04516